MKTAKAWVSGLFVVLMYLLARVTGAVELPPAAELNQALMDIGMAGVAFGVNWFMTWLIPNKEE